MKLLNFAVLVALAASPPLAIASDNDAKVIRIYKTTTTNGKPQTKDFVAALVNMDEIMDTPGDNCSQMIGAVKIEGVQFSASGVTLESFRFTSKAGNQYSVPTNIGKLSNADRGAANGFIKVGKTYLAHVHFCGSGGFPSLISLYDIGIAFGPN
jgi:hypothetical protein